MGGKVRLLGKASTISSSWIAYSPSGKLGPVLSSPILGRRQAGIREVPTVAYEVEKPHQLPGEMAISSQQETPGQ